MIRKGNMFWLLGVIFLWLSGALQAQSSSPEEKARWEGFAERITIHRDDYGVPHVYGKTDADAVFGMVYAQCEDDFKRVETNFINALGRMAEVEGIGKLYVDLRMRLYIDEEDLRAEYAASPRWLRELMDAWADGINYYLHTHPEVEPMLLTRFEPWMALSFSEGSIGGDIETIPVNPLKEFYDPAFTPPGCMRSGILS
ncbi:penicillin acylase family protein [Nitritalea halalkaliphila]|uniref:penicillin acylase family protein n=1 Tax=Nitritalea halalkaliphila TaxID=590849 RepID=UPI0002DF6109|nr:penicillin acylase family protein [Nitritalea halalkaliphila]